MVAKNSTFKPWGKVKQQLEQQAMVDSGEQYISKSQAKRDVTALQQLGNKLVELSKNTLISFNLDETLFDAILLAQTIHSHSGYRRQVQLIGKLMRQVDSDTIRLKLEHYHNPAIVANQQFHQLEQWRDRILKEGNSAINELVSQYPKFERARLRQLSRNAHKDTANNKPAKSARLLFQYLKEIMNEKS
jgi:ribosome-associated protein